MDQTSKEKVFFVVGASRSGTTMMGRVLGKNSTVHTFPEIHYINKIVNATAAFDPDEKEKSEISDALAIALCRCREGYWKTHNKDKYKQEADNIVASLDVPNFVEALKVFLFNETAANGKVIPCKQTPYYLEYAEELTGTLENPYFIAMIRDPHDIALSQKKRWKRKGLWGEGNSWSLFTLKEWANYHPILVSMMWISAIKKVERLVANNNAKVVKFEDLLRTPSDVLVDLCDFLQIDYESQMLDVPIVGSSHKADTGEIGLAADRAQAWKQNTSGNFIGLATDSFFTSKYLSDQGYEAGNEWNCLATVFALSVSIITLPFKLVLIALTNLRHIDVYINTIKRRFF